MVNGSAANTGDLNAQFCATLVDEWATQGVTYAVIAPGSRSTPLALALVRSGIQVSVVLDERSAAFLALGVGRATAMPAVLLCTSGTAAAHFLPAVIEAHHSNVPMIVCTADRPPELRDTGAGQTIDQIGMYGSALRWFCDPGAPVEGQAAFWRSVAARGCVVARGDGARSGGPVHYNLAFREPLLGDGQAMGVKGPRSLPSRAIASAATVAEVRAIIAANPRGVIVAGWGCDVSMNALSALSVATGWPLLADAISNSRCGDRVICHYEALIRDPATARALRPDAVLRFGAPLTSKMTNQWLDGAAAHVVVDNCGAWLDPLRSCTARISAHGEEFANALTTSIIDSVAVSPEARETAAERAWFDRWQLGDSIVATAFAAVLDHRDELSGARIGRDAISAVPTGSHLLVASSMAVRDFEWYSLAQQHATVHANRGANGIDGLVATACGIALASNAPTYAVLGDLAFLHDAGSLLGAGALDIEVTFIVVDNNGGGIFSFLPQSETTTTDEFEMLFGTPQHASLEQVAAGYGVSAVRVTTPSQLRELLTLRVGGVRVIVASSVDRSTEVLRHRELWDSAAQALASELPNIET